MIHSLSEAFTASFHALLREVHTMLPGVVYSFDPATQRAQIDIAENMQTDDGRVLPYPRLIDVPIQVLRWGSYKILIPVKPGAECAVFFAEKSMERFLSSGKTKFAPISPRVFSLSDGFAVMGLSSEPVSEYPTDAIEIRSGDLTLKCGDDGTFEVTNTSESLIPLLAEILQQLSSENVVVSSGSSAGTYNLTGGASYAALKARLETFTS